MKNYNTGVHQPTTDLPFLFEYPNSNQCRLIADGEFSNESGCPLHPGCSCSHGLEAYICEHGITPK